MLTGAILIFVYLTWTAKHLYNVALLFHPLGRHALDESERYGAIAVSSCLLGALTCMGISAATDISDLFLVGLAMLVYVIPLSATFGTEPGTRSRKLAVVITVLLGLTGAVGATALLIGADESLPDLLGAMLILASVLGSVLSSWLFTALAVGGGMRE